jgi:pimeloyl-ACP methyl ester carboxylesterase
LVITGGKDKLVPEETSNDVVKRLNNVKVQTFPDAGHSVPWTHEDELIKELKEFF